MPLLHILAGNGSYRSFQFCEWYHTVTFVTIQSLYNFLCFSLDSHLIFCEGLICKAFYDIDTYPLSVLETFKSTRFNLCLYYLCDGHFSHPEVSCFEGVLSHSERLPASLGSHVTFWQIYIFLPKVILLYFAFKSLNLTSQTWGK